MRLVIVSVCRIAIVLLAAGTLDAIAGQDFADHMLPAEEQAVLTADCTGQPDGLPCDDGNPCTSNDACLGGVCTGPAIHCNDGNQCTNDSCGPSGCVFTPAPDPPLPGSHPCSAGTGNCASSGWCFGGACSATPINCSDGNPCTTDYCTAVGGCGHTTGISPQELGTLYFAPDRVTFSWDPPPGSCQPSNYILAIGPLSQLPVGASPADEWCTFTPVGTPSFQDTEIPGDGEGIWYIVQTQYLDQLTGGSVHGTFGPQYVGGVHTARQTSACP